MRKNLSVVAIFALSFLGGVAQAASVPIQVSTDNIGKPPVAGDNPKMAAASTNDAIAKPSPPPVGVTVPDVKVLLNANGCLGCHGIQQKIVGPSYAEVASKYRGDAEAVGKLEASIRNGGTGKWGQIPMPPFMQLKPEELQALIEFVLKH